MNTYIEQIKHIIHSIQKRPTVYHKSGIHPHRDWNILFFSALTVLLLSGIWSYYIYREAQNGTLFPVTSEAVSNQVKIDTVLLHKISKRFDAKDMEAQRIQTSLKTPPDPSL